MADWTDFALEAGKGLLGYFTGSQADEATREAAAATNVANAQNTKESREAGFQALTGTTPTSLTKRNAAGGFDVSHLGPQADLYGAPQFPQAGNYGSRATGDFLRAQKTNEATRDFKPTFANLGEAVADAQAGVNKKREFTTDTINRFLESSGRKYRDENSGEMGATFKPLQKIFNQLPLAGEVGRANFNQQNTADNQLLAQILQNNAQRAQTLTHPGATASVIPGNIPAQATNIPPDFGGALATGAAGNSVSQLLQKIALDEANARSDKRFEQLIAASGGGGGRSALDPTNRLLGFEPALKF